MTDLSTSVLGDVKAIQDEIEAARKRLVEASKTAFSQGFEKVFDAYPFLGEVAWTQYTPYFNDGEECVFSVHDAGCASVQDVENGDTPGSWENAPDFDSHARKDVYVGYDSETRRSKYTANENYDPAYAECVDVVSRIVGGIDDETLRSMFGDHVIVRVKREGVTVEDYDHD